jgi:hypothetical protein
MEKSIYTKKNYYEKQSLINVNNFVCRSCSTALIVMEYFVI